MATILTNLALANKRARNREYMRRRRAAMTPEERQAANRASSAGHRKNPSKTRAWHKKWRLKKFYGLTAEQYERLRMEPCQICGLIPSATLGGNRARCGQHIDHIHNGQPNIRGVLCQNCNRGIGMFKENPELLRMAARYLVERGGHK